jgi:hypothetical protein
VHKELAPLTETATVRFHRAAVHFDEGLHQRQADAQPAGRTLGLVADYGLREAAKILRALAGELDSRRASDDGATCRFFLSNEPDADVRVQTTAEGKLIVTW